MPIQLMRAAVGFYCTLLLMLNDDYFPADTQNEKERVRKYGAFIRTLPPVNRATLAALIEHLYRSMQTMHCSREIVVMCSQHDAAINEMWHVSLTSKHRKHYLVVRINCI